MATSADFGPDEGPAQKVSVSMPTGRIAAVKERVGARGFSAYVSEAVGRRIQRDLAEELIQANEAESPPISQEMHDRATEAIRAAKSLAALEAADGEARGDVSWHEHEAS
ncbi:hypothetical protein [Streptomyces sp. NPDC050738]|uniref:hypothetical protein n=1 Tax=Streptomyces sp. NPDC050738 TaxID=3154744 RepID=UPI003423704A